MFNRYVTGVFAVPLVIALNGCGGGGGGGSDEFPQVGSSIPAMYRPASYENNTTSDLSLTGTWMLVARRDITIDSTFIKLRVDDNQRASVLINDNLDGTATVIDCLLDGVRQQTVSATGGVFNFSFSTTLSFQGSIVNNNLLEGSLVSFSPEVVVNFSDVSLVKINDLPSFPGSGFTLGEFSQTLTHNTVPALSGSLSNQPVHCFKQNDGDVTDTVSSVKSPASEIYFASIDEPTVPVATTSLVWLDAYFAELYFSSASSLDQTLQTQVPPASSMGTFSQTGDVLISIASEGVGGVAGDAANVFDPGNLIDIDIDFDINF